MSAPKNLRFGHLKNENDAIRYEIEGINCEFVIIYHTRAEWYGATGNSSLFLSHVILPEVGLRTKIKAKYDEMFDMTRLLMDFHIKQMMEIRDYVRKVVKLDYENCDFGIWSRGEKCI